MSMNIIERNALYKTLFDLSEKIEDIAEETEDFDSADKLSALSYEIDNLIDDIMVKSRNSD